MSKKVIFDTDLGADCDDVMALCLFIAAHKHGECELMGVTSSVQIPASAKCCASVLDFAGLNDIPVYSMSENKKYNVAGLDYYASRTLEKFPVDDSRIESVTSWKGIRKILSETDEKVIITATGSLANLAALVESEPDEFSPLDGISLVSEKVERFDVMAGNFADISDSSIFVTPQTGNTCEYNIGLNIGASRTFAEKCPVPIVWLPVETGNGIITGKPMVEKHGQNRPWSLAFICHGSINGRSSWDPATALYTVYGCSGVLGISESGFVTVDEKGITAFNPSPEGKSRILTSANNEACAALIDSVAELE